MKYKCNATGAVLEPKSAEVAAQLAKNADYTPLPDKPRKPAKE